MSRLKKSPAFSSAVALVALFFALGGTVYAAAGKIDGAQIQPKSIPGNRLKAKTVTSAQLGAGSVGGAAIKPNSLSATQIDQTTLTAISAADVHTVQYVSSTIALNKDSNSGTSGTAACPAGMKVIGGGATTSNSVYSSVFESAPSSDRNGWFANGYTGTDAVTMTITAICTPVAAPTG